MCVLGEGGVYVQLQTNKIRVYTVKKYSKYQTLRFVQDEIDEMGTTVIYQSSPLYWTVRIIHRYYMHNCFSVKLIVILALKKLISILSAVFHKTSIPLTQ